MHSTEGTVDITIDLKTGRSGKSKQVLNKVYEKQNSIISSLDILKLKKIFISC